MSDQSDKSRPKIYISQRGTRYVKADELLRSDAAKEVIDKMAKIATSKTLSAESK